MIYLIITVSIINRVCGYNSIQREQNYTDSIRQSLAMLPEGVQPIIVENNGMSKSFLDNFKVPVHYTDNNKILHPHKGINELDDIKSVIRAFNIKDDDFIIKLTGRYHPLTNNFFTLVKLNVHRYDAFIKFFNVCTNEFLVTDCVLGMFAIKCKYLKTFSYYDVSKSPEVEFATFVRERVKKLYEVNNLELRCCFANNLRIMDV